MWPALKQAKKTVVFLGVLDDTKAKFNATGFFVTVKGINHLVTAKHVIVDPNTQKFIDQELFVFINSSTTNKIIPLSIQELKQKTGVEWIFHNNTDVDIIILPFPYLEDWDFKSIPDNLFLSISNLAELYDVFFLSYQPGINPESKLDPIVRTGTICIIHEDKTFRIDGSAFPGNSGSPVFKRPSSISYSEKGVTIIGDDKLAGTFVGVIGEYLPYQDYAISAQTGRTRIIFEENTGISKVWSVDLLNEIIGSKKFQEQLDMVLKVHVPKEPKR